MDTGHKHILVEYGRRSYAFGLRWFVVEDDEPARKHAIAFVRRAGGGFDLMAERKGEYPQFTIASSAEGLKSGAIAAATIVAEMVPTDNWLYVAKIQNAIWITYGRDGRIMPQGDQIYTDEVEAREAFEKLEPGRWKTLVVPEDWDVGSSVENSDLKDIFQKPNKTTARLQPLASSGVLVKAILGVLLVGGLAFGGWQVFGPKEVGLTAEQQAEQARALADLARSQQDAVYAQLDADKPWQASPPILSLVEGCLKNITLMPLRPAGYIYDGAECASGSVTATYTRGESYPSWLREWVKDHESFQIDIDLETSNAFLSSEWSPPPERGPESLTDYVTMLRFLNESALLIEGVMTYTQPIEYRYEEHPEYVPLYGSSDLSIVTPQPEQWRLALERLPGVVINTVRLAADGNSYTMEGKIYVSNR